MNADMRTRTRTRTNSIKGLVCAIAALATIATAYAQSEVIYDNSSDPILGTFVPEDSGFEFGDQVTFAGTERVVTEFRLEYFSSEATGNAVIRFRANDGAADFQDGAPTNQLEPSTLLYQSDPIALQADFNQIEITGLSVPVPADWFTFTIEFTDLAGSLSYYFDKHRRVRRISFEGHTGDASRLVEFATKQFGVREEPTLKAGLYLARWNAYPTSAIYIRHAPVVREAAPRRRMEVRFEINRPDAGYSLSPEFLSLINSEWLTREIASLQQQSGIPRRETLLDRNAPRGGL